VGGAAIRPPYSGAIEAGCHCGSCGECLMELV
jgi:hypothetical protein